MEVSCNIHLESTISVPMTQQLAALLGGAEDWSVTSTEVLTADPLQLWQQQHLPFPASSGDRPVLMSLVVSAITVG
jgi:hypothetical protein